MLPVYSTSLSGIVSQLPYFRLTQLQIAAGLGCNHLQKAKLHSCLSLCHMSVSPSAACSNRQCCKFCKFTHAWDVFSPFPSCCADSEGASRHWRYRSQRCRTRKGRQCSRNHSCKDCGQEHWASSCKESSCVKGFPSAQSHQRILAICCVSLAAICHII